MAINNEKKQLHPHILPFDDKVEEEISETVETEGIADADDFDEIADVSIEDDIITKRDELARRCHDSLYEFFVTFWSEMSGSEYVDNWHIKAICDTVQKYAEPVIKGERGLHAMNTLIVNVPPSSSKSTIISIAFPIWLWVRNPYLATINISHGDTLSEEHSNKSRAIFESELFQSLYDDYFKVKYGKKFTIGKMTGGFVQNSFKGLRQNGTPSGKVTGSHYNILIVDDLINAEQARSKLRREKANLFYDETLSSRLRDPQSYLFVVVGQRLHEADVCGHIVKRNPVGLQRLCLPAEITENAPVMPEKWRDYYKEEEIADDEGNIRTVRIMDANRNNAHVLKQKKIIMGNDSYSGQMLQIPYDLSSSIIKPAMFKIIDSKELPTGMVWDVWIDGAYTEKTENDPSGIMIAGYRDGMMYVKNVWNVHKTLPELVDFVKELGHQGLFSTNKGRVMIEPKASGHSLYQYLLKDTTFNAILINNEFASMYGGKIERHNMIQPKAESGRIALVNDGWNDEYIDQICGFPKAAHDEQVDNTGYAIYHYFYNEHSLFSSNVLKHIDSGIQEPLHTTSLFENITESSNGTLTVYSEPENGYIHRYVIGVVAGGQDNNNNNAPSIYVHDRQTNKTAVTFVFDNFTNISEIAKATITLARLYYDAKIIVCIKKAKLYATHDHAPAFIAELLKTRYKNIFFALVRNKVRVAIAPEYGYSVDEKTNPDIFHNLKDKIESGSYVEIDDNIASELHNLELRSDGTIQSIVGTKQNLTICLAVVLSVSEGMKPVVDAPIERFIPFSSPHSSGFCSRL